MNNTRLVIGESYHVYGWNYKAVFKLTYVGDRLATLKTPKTGRIVHAPLDKLFYTAKTKKRLSQQDTRSTKAKKGVQKNAPTPQY